MERLAAEGSDSSQSVERLPVLTEPSRSGSPPGGVHRHPRNDRTSFCRWCSSKLVVALPEVGAPIGQSGSPSGLLEKNWRTRAMLG
jgi:hypothetical protein